MEKKQHVIRKTDNALMEVIRLQDDGQVYEVRNVWTQVISFIGKSNTLPGPSYNPYEASHASWCSDTCIECNTLGHWIGYAPNGVEIGTWCDICQEVELATP